MDPAVRHPSGDDRIWEHRLFPLLVMAFGVAAGATLASPRPPLTVPRHRVAFDEPAVRPASFASPRPMAEAPGGGLSEVRIVDVVINDGDTTSVVLLTDQDSEIVIPIFVASEQAMAIREQLKNSHSATGLAGLKSFLAQTITALGGTVERIEVREHAAQALKSQVVIRHDNSQVALDAALPEALALAAATGTPVYVAPAVLSDEGIHKEAIMRRPGGFPSPLRRPDSL